MIERLGRHRSRLLRGNHHNTYLQASWNKYGADAFVFAPLHLLPKDDMTPREKSYIDGAYGLGLHVFNLCMAMPSNRSGVRHSVAARAKMSLAKLGRKASTETIVARLGRKLSLEHRTNISKAQVGHTRNLGRRASAETRAKMSAARLGKKLSVETRAKISAAQAGQNNSCFKTKRLIAGRITA